MKKRLLALVLCLATAIALIPAMPAEATVLPGMTSKVDYDNTDPNRYTIEIDLVNQIITVYEGAIGGPIVLQSLCTTGNEENPTGAAVQAPLNWANSRSASDISLPLANMHSIGHRWCVAFTSIR